METLTVKSPVATQDDSLTQQAQDQAALMHKALRIIGHGTSEGMRRFLAEHSRVLRQEHIDKMDHRELALWVARTASSDRLISA